MVGRLFVLEFKPSSASTSPPWPWRSSIWNNWITRNPSTRSKSLGGCTFCLFLWSLDQNFKIERALHFVIQLWISCKKALRSDSLECQTQNFGTLLFLNYDWHMMHVYKFTRIDCPSHYLEENIEPFLYLQYSKCVHESRSRNISKGNSSGRNIWLISSNTDKNPVKHHHEKKLIYPVDWVDKTPPRWKLTAPMRRCWPMLLSSLAANREYTKFGLCWKAKNTINYISWQLWICFLFQYWVIHFPGILETSHFKTKVFIAKHWRDQGHLLGNDGGSPGWLF